MAQNKHKCTAISVPGCRAVVVTSDSKAVLLLDAVSLRRFVHNRAGLVLYEASYVLIATTSCLVSVVWMTI